jgi:uncharacterized membrane protein
MTFGEVVDGIGRVIDVAGVLAIAGAIAGAAAVGAARLVRREHRVYHRFRQEVGRGILLGLEFLVAADIIRTVVWSRPGSSPPGAGSATRSEGRRSAIHRQ